MKTKYFTVCCALVIFIIVSLAYTMDPPYAYWALDEKEGDTAFDAIGTRNGTWVGNQGWVPEGGRYAGAIECNDDSSFIIVDDSDATLFDDLGTEFTLSLWVLAYEFTQDWQGILFKNNKLFLERNNSAGNGTVNGIHFKAKDETGSQPFNLYGNITIDDGEWHHIVGIYDNDMAYLFVDNVLDVEGPADGNMLGLVPDPLVIGAKFEDNYRNSWMGLIDEVKIFDYALSVEDIDVLYNMEAAVKSKHTQQLPDQCTLYQNFPNPFNPETSITFEITEPSYVTLEVVNLNGQHIRTLLHGNQNPGAYTLLWDGRDESGFDAPSGVYLYRLVTENFSQTHKMLLTR